MNFSAMMHQDLIRVDFTARHKDEALRQIASIAAEAPVLQDVGGDVLYEKLQEREAAVSTGLGNGVAIPHARIEGLTEFVVFALLAPRGVEFAALDKRKVQVFFVVFAPADRVTEQLKVLATISRMLSQPAVKREVLQASDTDTLYEVIVRNADEGGAAKSTRNETCKLMLLILYYEEDLQAVLEYLIDQGIEGATILESQGMGAYISTMPLFAGFLSFMREDRNASHIILALVPARHEKLVVQGIESITGDLDKKQGAMLLMLDVSFFKGTMDMI